MSKFEYLKFCDTYRGSAEFFNLTFWLTGTGRTTLEDLQFSHVIIMLQLYVKIRKFESQAIHESSYPYVLSRVICFYVVATQMQVV